MAKAFVVFVLTAVLLTAAELPTCLFSSKLADAYLVDKAAASAKYRGRVLVLTGIVDHLGIGSTTVDLKGNDAALVRASGTNFSSLRPGQSVTLRCQSDGTTYPITVSSCSIVSPKTACTPEKQGPISQGSPNLVQLTLASKLQGNSLLVSGTTNLKDGAVISYEIDHELFPIQTRAKNWTATGDIAIKEGRYAASVNVTGWGAGKITVSVGFQTFVKRQPQWVKTQYGDLGQKMEGPTVKVTGNGLKQAEVERIVVKP